MANRRRFAARRSGGRRPPGAGLDRTQAEGRAGASPHQAGLPGAQGQGRDHIGRASARPRSPATAAPCSRLRPPAPTCLTRTIAGGNDVALPRGPRRGGRRPGLWREPRLTGKAGDRVSHRRLPGRLELRCWGPEGRKSSVHATSPASRPTSTVAGPGPAPMASTARLSALAGRDRRVAQVPCPARRCRRRASCLQRGAPAGGWPTSSANLGRSIGRPPWPSWTPSGR